MPEYWEDCKVPWITLADVWQLRTGRVDVIKDTKEKISSLGLANSSAVRHPAGTVILSRTASVGFSAIMGTAMATSQDFATWTCGPDLDPRFLLHSLRAMAPDLKRVATGSTHKTIYMPDIEQLRVPLPSIGEQRRVADFLDAETARIDALLEARDRQMNLLTLHAASSLNDVMERLSREYGTVRLRRVLMSMEQGWSPQCEDRHVGDGEWGVVKAGCVNSGRFDVMQHKALPPNVEPRKEYKLRDGDLLMSRASGSPELIGSIGVVEGLERQLLLCDKVYRLRVDRTRALAPFIAHALRCHSVREYIKLGISGAEGMANNLPTAVVMGCLIPEAPLAVQRDVVAEREQEEAAVKRMRASIGRASSLLAERRQSLITAAVTGQLDVTTAGRAAAV